jgi:DNA-binding FadR family transcriptional regulator
MMLIQPVRSAATLVDQLCEKLAQHLGSLPKNDHPLLPPERVLAKQFGVSRTVFREAAKRLEFQGLIEIRHGSGIRAVRRLHKPLSASLTFLLPNRTDRLRQLTETRALIEPEIAARAAQRSTKADIRELEHIHSQLANSASTRDAVFHDIAFHRKLAEMAGNQVLSLLLDSLAELGRESRETTIGNVGAHAAIAHHRTVLDALIARDSEAARTAMAHHLHRAAEDLTKTPKPRKKRDASKGDD